ncbi:hypothetical protein [Paenibacillus sp. Soil750]|uniref:hypothetical protein n=1 Tax=Paenibacillus sp. Soil750 TaxID=1736398 RepID=UPI0006F849DA|nr:hypothetical protein [Paenibacillus sp. Soil750]KRE61838.1 hypothetical protein ASL11_24045 [Paenibacillus sp. Soil750]
MTVQSDTLEISALHYRTGEPIRITVDNGCISAITSIPTVSSGKEQGLFIGPGLVDLQLNGYVGDDFNPLPSEGYDIPLERIVRRLAEKGVTTFYPTVITNSSEELGKLLTAIDQACQQNPASAAFVGGIHLEGPFISPEDGARGPLAHVAAPDWELLQRWQEASGGRIRLLTMSPEWAEVKASSRVASRQI